MIDCKNFFDQPINGELNTYENIRRMASGLWDVYTPGCLLDYSYFKTNSKMIAVDLSKQQFLDANPKVIQQIKFMASLDNVGNVLH